MLCVVTTIHSFLPPSPPSSPCYMLPSLSSALGFMDSRTCVCVVHTPLLPCLYNDKECRAVKQSSVNQAECQVTCWCHALDLELPHDWNGVLFGTWQGVRKLLSTGQTGVCGVSDPFCRFPKSTVCKSTPTELAGHDVWRRPAWFQLACSSKYI